jgi:hypothetical protein
MISTPQNDNSPSNARLSLGQTALIIALCILFIIACSWAAFVWTNSGTVAISTHGWIALSIGLFFSLAIGCGLMALMFYSSRSGHDEVATPNLRRDPDDPSN